MNELEIENLQRMFECRYTFELACMICENSTDYMNTPEFVSMVQNKDFALEDRIEFNDWQERNFCFSFAKALSSGHNQLTILPAEIGILANLKELACSQNKLTVLPDEIGNLANLETLYCENNQLTTLPENISKLYNLERLFCSHNNFSDTEKQRIKDILPNCEIYFY